MQCRFEFTSITLPGALTRLPWGYCGLAQARGAVGRRTSADCRHVLVAAEFAGRRCRVKGRACSIARATPSGALDAVPVAGEHRRGEGMPVGALIAVTPGS